jgi:hypothetical protein
MTPIWFFFGIVCMQNAPTDCTRVVFDVPRNVAASHLPTPPAFQSAADCVRALPEQWGNYAPLRVMGSEWVQIGCTGEIQK